MFDSRTPRSTSESGARAGDDEHKRRQGTTAHLAEDTRGRLLALHVSPANAQDRAQDEPLAAAVQEPTGASVKLASIVQADIGAEPAKAAATYGIHLHVVTLPDARRGFAAVPRRWVAERSFAWKARWRRLARDEPLPRVAVGLHVAAYL